MFANLRRTPRVGKSCQPPVGECRQPGTYRPGRASRGQTIAGQRPANDRQATAKQHVFPLPFGLRLSLQTLTSSAVTATHPESIDTARPHMTVTNELKLDK